MLFFGSTVKVRLPICYKKIIYENNRDRPGGLYRGGGGGAGSCPQAPVLPTSEKRPDLIER